MIKYNSSNNGGHYTDPTPNDPKNKSDSATIEKAVVNEQSDNSYDEPTEKNEQINTPSKEIATEDSFEYKNHGEFGTDSPATVIDSEEEYV